MAISQYLVFKIKRFFIINKQIKLKRMCNHIVAITRILTFSNLSHERTICEKSGIKCLPPMNMRKILFYLQKLLFQSGLLSFVQILLVFSEITLCIKLLIAMDTKVIDSFMYCLLVFSKISL